MVYIIIMETLLWPIFCGLAYEDMKQREYLWALIPWCIGWVFFFAAVGHAHMYVRKRKRAQGKKQTCGHETIQHHAITEEA